MKSNGIWFNDEEVKKAKKEDFIKNHKHLALTDDQLSDIWISLNPPKKDPPGESAKK